MEMSSGFLSAPRKAPTYQQSLDEVWAEFLNKNFKSNEEAAVFFDVSEKTIRNWKSGVTGMKGEPLVKALKRFPTFRQLVLGEQ